MGRVAVLIGINYLQKTGSLSCVGPDLARMAAALTSTGYKVHTILTDEHVNSKYRISQKVRHLATDGLDEDDVFMLYFTGHGFQTDDGLVVLGPEYEHPDYNGLADSGIYQQDVNSWLEECPAGVVLVVTDICREGIAFKNKVKQWRWPAHSDQTINWITSCEADKFSRYRKNGSMLSHFTEAFAGVIEPTHAATTILMAFVETQRALDAIIQSLYNGQAGQCRQILCGHFPNQKAVANLNSINKHIFDATAASWSGKKLLFRLLPGARRGPKVQDNANVFDIVDEHGQLRGQAVMDEELRRPSKRPKGLTALFRLVFRGGIQQ